MEPYLGQINAWGCNFAPRGWTTCRGQLLPIAQNTALFSLLGTIYGGDGRTTFAVPDLQGRIPIGQGRGPGLTERRIGSKGGQESVTLTELEIPSHNHSLNIGTGTDFASGPDGHTLPGGLNVWGDSADVSMNAASMEAVGGSQSHENRPPGLALNFCIAIMGVYPSRS